MQRGSRIDQSGLRLRGAENTEIFNSIIKILHHRKTGSHLEKVRFSKKKENRSNALTKISVMPVYKPKKLEQNKSSKNRSTYLSLSGRSVEMPKKKKDKKKTELAIAQHS